MLFRSQSFVGGNKRRQVVASLVAIWTAALSLATPGVLFSHLLAVNIGSSNGNRTEELGSGSNGTANGTTSATNRTIFVCYPFPREFGPDYAKLIIAMRAVLLYALPLIVIGAFYGNMAQHLLRRFETLHHYCTERVCHLLLVQKASSTCGRAACSHDHLFTSMSI